MPELDDLTPEAPEATPEPEPFVLPEDFAAQVQNWEVPLDKLPEAVQMYKTLQTEEGVIDGFISMGQQLGFGIKELNRLFADDEPPAQAPPAATAPAPEPVDPDALMTRAEVDAMISQVRQEQEQFAAQQQQAAFQQRQAVVFDAIGQWYETNGYTDEAERRQIAAYGEKHILPGQDSYDPRVSIAALERGKAEYEAWREHQVQTYLKTKGLTATAQPTPPGGGQGYAGDGGEPQVDYAEHKGQALTTAMQRVRDRLRQSGELG